MDTRPSKAATFLKMALVLSEQGTCIRRKVGVIFTDDKHHIISAGYNGGAPGLSHCIDIPCLGASMPTGEGLDMCEATHAEQNALMWCSDVNKIHSIYVTTFPCIHCIKMLMNTSAVSIYYIYDYAHNEHSKRLWMDSSPERMVHQRHIDKKL